MTPYRYLPLIISLLFTACTANTTNENRTDESLKLEQADLMPPKELIKSKLLAFNDIQTLRDKLSRNGIGPLGKWMSDGVDGFMSITSYYRFGPPSSINGMDNNLAYYLESDNNKYIRSLKLVLNINNVKEKRAALFKMKEMVKKTFESLHQNIPAGLEKAVTNGKAYNSANKVCEVAFLLDRSNIDTWTLMVKTK